MGLQELRAGSPQGAYKSCGLAARRGFETQDGFTRTAGWQPARVLRPKAYKSCGLAARRGFETQDGLTRAAGWQPAGVLRPKMGLQELRAASPQGF